MVITKSRKIVLVLGNGFDLDLGLKTSYKDFWESDYCPKDYPAPLIYHLNKCWPDGLDSVRWYDLENEMLNYYNSIPDPEIITDYITDEEKSFLKRFEAYKYQYGLYNDSIDIIKSLVEKGVIRITNNPINPLDCPFQNDVFQSPEWRDKKAFELIKTGLLKYIDSVGWRIREEKTLAHQVLLTMRKCTESGSSVSIYTFNYTPVLLQGFKMEGISTHYMHGSCADKKIVVGTRDNLNMVQSYDFLQKAMDDNFMPPDLVTAMKDADEVIVFGHSLGENDRQYFAPFFLAQSRVENAVRKDITLFTKDNASKKNLKRALLKMTEGKLSELHSINQPVIIRTDDIEDDQWALLDFYNKHNVNEEYSRDVIGKLIQHYGSTSSTKESVDVDSLFANYIMYDPDWTYRKPIPDKPGNYIVLMQSPHSFPKIGYNLEFSLYKNMPIIYTGSTGNSLKNTIISQELDGNADPSTLRQSIGCLLRYEQIPRDLNNPNNGQVCFSSNDEDAISYWMNRNLLFYYLPNDKPEELEAQLIKQLNPPLNLKHNRNKINVEFRSALQDLMSQKPWLKNSKNDVREAKEK